MVGDKMKLTATEYSQLKQVLRRYAAGKTLDGRGPDCFCCDGALQKAHAGISQPVCVTVDEITERLWELVMNKPVHESERS